MIRLALPNKGRLAEEARALLARAGLELDMVSERALQASLGGEFVALFVRAKDIPELVADGAADVGITGRDLVVESGRELDEVLDLGFGRCRVVVAVREDSAIHSLACVPDGARVATVFPRIAAACFARAERRITIVPMSGAAEIAPHLGVADIVVDITSTGSTLKVNGLREVATVLESSALLIARPSDVHSARARGARAVRRTGVRAARAAPALSDGERAAQGTGPCEADHSRHLGTDDHRRAERR
jgi:ATP phosphoribosyltransferase